MSKHSSQDSNICACVIRKRFYLRDRLIKQHSENSFGNENKKKIVKPYPCSVFLDEEKKKFPFEKD
jgi:hypothetical protein